MPLPQQDKTIRYEFVRLFEIFVPRRDLSKRTRGGREWLKALNLSRLAQNGALWRE